MSTADPPLQCNASPTRELYALPPQAQSLPPPHASSQRPSLQLPSLHLGSFDSLSSLHSASPPVGESIPIQSSLSSSASPTVDTPRPFQDALSRAESSRFDSSSLTPTAVASASIDASVVTLGPTTPSSAGDHGGAAATLTAPTSQDPGPASLPLLSPISTLSAPSFGDFGYSLNDEDNQPTPLPDKRWSQRESISARRASTLPTVLSSLSVHTDSPLSPTGSTFGPASPRLRESPGVPRRRTIIQTSSRVAPQEIARVSKAESSDLHETPPSPSPRSKRLATPLAEPSAEHTVVESGTAAEEDPSDRKGQELLHKRSLPRPPRNANRMSASEATQMPIPMPSPVVAAPPPNQLYTSPKAIMNGMNFNGPTPYGRLPDKQQLSAPLEMPMPRSSPTMAAPSQMPMAFTPSHQATNSASNLPPIAGLADAGPYPTAQPQVSRTAMAPGRPPIQGLKPPEEVCLECMMRDRDLADVTVQGPGVWERGSDADWNDLKSREFEILRTLSLDHSRSGTSLEGASSADSQSISTSPRSHASSLPQDEATMRKQMREARRSKRDERDAQINRVGWRGFKWEEGSSGEGFPKGFRGTRPGALTEKGIKNVMTMYPSASALRYQILQSYLRGQYRSILEVRQEAQRVGHYAEPEEPHYPTSPTISSHESSTASRHPRVRASVDVGRGGGAPSIKAPSISTARSLPITSSQQPSLRPSPSTPAGLGSQVYHTRPRTQYDVPAPVPVINPNHARPSLNLNTSLVSPPTRPTHLKGPSTSSVPKLGRDSRYEDWSDTEDLWPPASPASGNLRPFSFAVRAGQQQSRDGSDQGHNPRRSFFGRFGGSVTSLFTGSHGGSGSMMDMHLGLDMDRRNRTSSYQVHDSFNPRVVSMVSPSRPGYQSRQSLSASVYMGGAGPLTPPPRYEEAAEPARRDRRARSVSTSRLTQVSLYDDVEEPSSKKKGLKGLLQKMKGGKGKKDGSTPSPRPETDAGSSDLAPPPPIPFLVHRGEKIQVEHDRKPSAGSSLSITDDNLLNAPMMHQATRSVSAPLVPTVASQGASPTDTRFVSDRQGDASQPRRRTEPPPELPPGAGDSGFRRGSVMEMLTASSHASPPHPVVTPEAPVYDEPMSMSRENGVPNGQANGQANAAYGQSANYRKSKQPSLSSRYSTSTTTVPAIETPDPAMGASYLLPNQAPSTPDSLSPNRYKNLPPLPPGMAMPENYPDEDLSVRTNSMYDSNRLSVASSAYPRTSMLSAGSLGSDAPTVHRAALPPSADYFPTASPRFHQQGLMPANGVPFPQQHMQPPQHQQPRQLQPRASFDVLAERAQVRRSVVPGGGQYNRNAQSMYLQQPAAASTGSFGRFMNGGDKDVRAAVVNSVPVTEDKKERRRGIKSIFSKAR